MLTVGINKKVKKLNIIFIRIYYENVTVKKMWRENMVSYISINPATICRTVLDFSQ